MKNIIFKALVGSHAYGTNIEGSDKDYKGVYIQSPEDVLQNGYIEQIEVSKDETYYELKRFVQLCCTGNPTMLELLYTPEDCVIYKHPVFQFLITNKHSFLSKSCKYSFGGYAYSQIVKAKGLNKKMNWEKSKTERKTVLDFCYVYDNLNYTVEDLKSWLKKENYDQKYIGLTSLPHFRYMYNIYYDDLNEIKSTNPRYSDIEIFNYKGIIQDVENSNDISLSEVPEYQRKNCKGLMYFNKDEYSRHCKDYKSYQEWLLNRSTQRYIDIEQHNQKIDGKNLLHCYRLLETGIEIAKEEKIIVRRPNAQYLREIRKGKHNLDKLLEETDIKLQELNEAFDSCNLREHADKDFLYKLIPEIREKFYLSTEEKLEL